MSKRKIIRAWKDPEYRRSLSAEERAMLPENPAGLVELEDADISLASGGGIFTTPITLCFILFTCALCQHTSEC